MTAPSLTDLAQAERLLVATDFDGVLAPIVADPAAASAVPASLEALRRLAVQPDTNVAVVSGRDYDRLAELVAPAEGVTLVGSHGAEIGPAVLTLEERRLLNQLLVVLPDLAQRFTGLHVEEKTLSVAVHFRRMTERRSAAVEVVQALVADWPAKVISGKEVVEFAIRHATKGDAVRTLAADFSATRTVYLGDDVTDEDVFAVLGPDDIGIKVGPGETGAGHRLESPNEVTDLLVELARARAEVMG